MNTTSIDYDAVWLEQAKAFDHSSDTADYWNRRSRTFNSCWRTSTYAEDLLSRMAISPVHSVLDVACGTGVVSIPLSRRVKHVTALDISPNMLERLNRQIAAAGITNISPVNKDWNRVKIGEDIEEHDVVLVSRALPNIRLSETLQRVNRAAKSACYITWRVERVDAYERAVTEAMGKIQNPYPDYRIVSGMLDNMGFSSKTEIFESLNEDKYPSLEEAVFNMSRGLEINEGQFNRLLALARNRLVPTNGFYYNQYKMKWALISWHKAI